MLSAISLWEVAMLIDRGRIKTKRTTHEWIHAALTIGPIRLANLTPSIACQAFDLPKGFHKDPADRIIAATALDHDVPLVTSDKQIIQHPHLIRIHSSPLGERGTEPPGPGGFPGFLRCGLPAIHLGLPRAGKDDAPTGSLPLRKRGAVSSQTGVQHYTRIPSNTSAFSARIREITSGVGSVDHSPRSWEPPNTIPSDRGNM